MRNKGQLYIGVALLGIGGLILIRNLTGIRLWPYIWPTLIIVLGAWLIIRPRTTHEGTDLTFRFIADLDRDGPWRVTDEEIWTFVGDIDLDMGQATLPPGETRLRIFSFVGDVKLRVPQNVGVAVSTTAFFTEAKVLGEPYQGFLAPVIVSSPNYETAEQKVFLELTCFVATPTIKQS